jgi:transcriptional regulator with XRE-family HTH domain
VLPIYQLEIRAKMRLVSLHWWELKGGAKMSPVTIGEHMKKRRLELGFDQQQVANKMGVTCMSVSNWERGIYRPSKKTMRPIVSFLGYDPRREKPEVNTCSPRCPSASRLTIGGERLVGAR